MRGIYLDRGLPKNQKQKKGKGGMQLKNKYAQLPVAVNINFLFTMDPTCNALNASTAIVRLLSFTTMTHITIQKPDCQNS